MLALGFVTTRSQGVSGRGSKLEIVRLLNRAANARWLDEIGFISARKASAVDVSDIAQSARHDHIPVSRALIDRVAPDNDRYRKGGADGASAQRHDHTAHRHRAARHDR